MELKNLNKNDVMEDMLIDEAIRFAKNNGYYTPRPGLRDLRDDVDQYVAMKAYIDRYEAIENTRGRYENLQPDQSESKGRD